MMNINNNFIAIDWGSSNFRAFWIEDGHCIETISSERGIKFIENGEFEAFLKQVLQPWVESIKVNQIPIIMAGMIGSDKGWVNTGYQSLPISINDIKKKLYAVENSLGISIYIKPGISLNHHNVANIMRGEEVQLLGAYSVEYDCFVFPGTHSKWLALDKNTHVLSMFHTVMTGELFDVLMNHSLLGVDEQYPLNKEAFLSGVDAAKNSNVDIIEQLFYARAGRVLNQLLPSEVEGWLSGLLIGHEIKSQLLNFPDAQTIAIIANDRLSKLYLDAFNQFNIIPTLFNVTDITIKGFRSIYEALDD